MTPPIMCSIQANSADSDEKLQNAASHQGLHYFQLLKFRNFNQQHLIMINRPIQHDTNVKDGKSMSHKWVG